MDRLVIAIALKDKAARTFRIVRIVLNHDGVDNTRDDISDQDAVICELIIPVLRDSHIPAVYQQSDGINRRIHYRPA